MSILVASGTVDLGDTNVSSCPFAATCRYPNAGPWTIPAGNHHLKITLTNLVYSGTGNQVGLYTGSSNTHHDVTVDGLTTASVEADYPITDTLVDFFYWGPTSFTGFDFVIEATPAALDSTPTYCAYGTEPQSGFAGAAIITTGLIDLALAAAGVGAWLAIVFDTFVGYVIWGGQLCSGPPPTFPTFTSDDFVAGNPNLPNPASLDKWWTGLLAIMWPYFCQCTPGSPTPVEYPAPYQYPPSSAPTAPAALTCSNTDICTALDEVYRQLTAMSTSLATTRSMIQLVQRQEVPFGVIASTIHSGLTGTGSIAVSDILGLKLSYTGGSSAIGEEAGTPNTLFDAGWVNLGDSNGYRNRERIRTNPWVWLPDKMGEVTVIGYTLNPLVTAAITELVREP